MMQAPDATVKQPRRANGEGSTFFWPGRGWYAAVTGPDGRRVMRKAPKQTERGAETLLRQLLKQRDEGALTRRSTTLSQFKEEWLTACKRRQCKPGTLDNYRKKIESYVEPSLGRTRLDKITAGQVDRLYDELADSGLSAGTIRGVHVSLNNLLTVAKRRKLVGQVVTELVEPPKVKKYEARVLTIDEAKRLLIGIREHRYGPIWTVMLGLGCRHGEVLGLRWSDVDL